MSNRTVLQIALVLVIVVWGAAMVATFFSPEYKPPEGLVGGLTGIGGAIVYALGKTDTKDDDDSPEGRA